ncbi:MAG: LamG domain-containing protein [Pseudomonadota bacterium]|nr:LamG domain-containing protein [Pseudomonadota bacterium]
MAVLLPFSMVAQAAPGDVLFSDDFERNSLGGDWNASSNQLTGISNQTSNSGSRSMYTHGGTVTVTTRSTFDLSSVGGAELSVWVRRGDDAFSENPENNEDLIIEYLNASNNWIQLAQYLGDDTPGQIYTPTFTLQSDALHANFQIRFRQTGGSGNNWDYYHIDDVVLTETAATPSLSYPFCDDFENGMGNWNIISSGGNAGTGSQTYQSANNSLYLRWDEVAVESLEIDASGISNPLLTLWVQRGDDAFSENPDNNEDLRIEYLDNSGSWNILQTLPGGGTPGETFDLNFTLPADAAHAGLKVRFYMQQGNGSDFDYWHVDDVCLGQPSTASLIASYAQDESAWDGTSGEVIDSSGNDLHGTAQNGASTAPAKVCRGGLFDGSDDYVDVPNLSDNLNDTASLAFWIKTTQTGNNTAWQAPGITGVEQSGGTDDIFWGWIDASGHIGITVGNDNTAKSNSAINDDLWHHIVLTRNASNGEYKIYIDGNLNASGTIASGTIGTQYSSIGRIEDTGGSPEYFQGALDEVLIFDTVLTDAQVQAGYTNQNAGNNWDGTGRSCATTPLALYHLDETAWGPVTDTSGNGNDGSTLGTVSPASTNPVVSGDPGTCGYADIANNTSASVIDAIDTGIDIDSQVGNQGTISFWYKSNERWGGNNGNRQLFDASSSSSGKYFHLTLLSQGGGNNGVLQFGLEDSNDSDFRIETGNNNINANTWAHIAVTWDLGADEVNIYLNGSLEQNGTINSNGVLGELDTLFIGDNRSTYLPNDSTGNSANGSFDEVRLYNIVQNQTQVAADMNATHPCSGQLDHIEIEHDGTALTCNAETINFRACVDSGCTTLYSGDVSVTLSPTGWDGGDSKTISGGSASFDLRHNTAGTVTLDIASSSPSTTNPPVCVNTADGTSSCDLTFYDTGFLIDVPTQTSCQTSGDLTISAVRTDETTQKCVPAFSSTTKNLKLWATYSDPASGTQNVTLTHATNDYTLPATEPGATNVPVQFDANADATYNLTYPDAGQLVLNARYDGTGDEAGLVMLGNDTYVTKPARLYVYSDDTNAVCPSGDATCSLYTAAGNNFNLKVRGACADTSLTPNFRLNNISLGHNLVAPAGGVTGSINVNNFDITAADGGEHLINNQTVSEVGVFTFTASLGVGVSYFGETTIGNAALNTSANIGRFSPHHFDLAATEACNGTFTYSGQPFTVTLDSLNLGGNPTRNYRDGFVRDPVISDAGDTTNFTNNTLDTTYFTTNDGIGVRNDITYTFPNKETAPLSITQLRATDGDGISSSGYTEGQVNIRSGRIALDNAYGSELADLQVPMFAQYYDGSNFVTNTLDVCDNGVTISLLNPTDTVSVDDGDTRGETCVQDIGNPGNNSGTDGCAVAASDTDIQYTDTPDDGVYTLYLKAPDTDAGFDPANPIYGNVTVRGNAPGYLQFDWDGDGSEEDPEATATFGRYRGDDRIIYWRERFQ